MDSNQSVFFPEIDTLVSHLKYILGEKLTPIRLQKSLYFLFAFYGASYGQLNSNETEEGSFEGAEQDAYPKELFSEGFEAWKFGPVIPTVYHQYKSVEIESKEWVPETTQEHNVQIMIRAVISQLEDMGDFELVERTHEDKSWKEVYDHGRGQSKPMVKEDIVSEYLTTI